MASETMAILKEGRYESAGSVVTIADDVQRCVESTQLFRPHDLARIRDEVLSRPAEGDSVAIEVEAETTLVGIARLIQASSAPVAALNFASAKNPGGGFLSGSQAQEESLARSSALHPSLMKAWDYYEEHRREASPLYSDSMILSPHCPIFRDDAGDLLPKPHHATFISAAAPNAGAVRTNAPQDASRIPEVFARRAEYVLALASAQGYRHIVLGAWGCGVFRNDPRLVADIFMQLLGDSWAKRFSRIVFSILDPELVALFRKAA